MLRPLRAFAALLAAAFMLTGCMKIDMNLTIDADKDVIDGSLIFAMDKQVLALSGKSPEESFKDTGQLDDLPKGSRSEIYDDGKFYGRKLFFEQVPFAEFNSTTDGPRISHADGRYVFSFDAESADLGDAAVLGPALDSIEYTIAVTFPGNVIERDSKARLEGRTVSWVLKLSEKHELRAVSEEPSSFPWLLLGAVAGLFGLLVVVGIIVLAVRMNKSAAEPALVAHHTDPDMPTAVIQPAPETLPLNEPTPQDRASGTDPKP